MANKPSSLLDDAEFGNIGKSKQERGKAKGGDSSTTKLLLVVAMFAISGGVLGWYYLWPESIPESAKPGGKGALTSSDQEAAKKQEQKVKEDLEKPELFHGPS